MALFEDCTAHHRPVFLPQGVKHGFSRRLCRSGQLSYHLRCQLVVIDGVCRACSCRASNRRPLCAAPLVVVAVFHFTLHSVASPLIVSVTCCMASSSVAPSG